MSPAFVTIYSIFEETPVSYSSIMQSLGEGYASTSAVAGKVTSEECKTIECKLISQQ